ncbi:MAG TPA: TetR/AcrR family transcriptional regulator [Caulobacteraceae bacterium]|nr:TetR/AcrR family transcriptional regulator [Caulobacteraceae bacterium]
MRETGSAATARPYHHGDLRNALVQAARTILEKEGPAALSLRAVAREAGVSPAAPYHHFKDKCELLDAVAQEGWEQLGHEVAQARSDAPCSKSALTDIGVAYVKFARANPALYRVMYDGMRDRTAMPEHAKDAGSGWTHVGEAIVAAGGKPDPQELQLATIAAWCAAHGLAEMATFREFEPLKEALGGEDAFLRAILEHIGVFTHAGRPKA